MLNLQIERLKSNEWYFHDCIVKHRTQQNIQLLVCLLPIHITVYKNEMRHPSLDRCQSSTYIRNPSMLQAHILHVTHGYDMILTINNSINPTFCFC